MDIKFFLARSLINTGDLAAGMPRSDSDPQMESNAATPARCNNLATSGWRSPGKPRGFTVSPTSKKFRSPGGRGQISGDFHAKKGNITWRALVPEEADDKERNGIKKRLNADWTFASKQAKSLKMALEEKEPGAKDDHGIFTPAKLSPDLPPFVILAENTKLK